MWRTVKILWSELSRVADYHDEAERRSRALRRAAARSGGRVEQVRGPLSFVVRVQSSGSDGNKARLRCRVVHVGAGTERLFDDLDDAMTFIRSAVAAAHESRSRQG